MLIRLGITFIFYSKSFLKHAIDMENQSFIFFTIAYELNNLNADNFLNNDFRIKRMLFNEITLRTLPFIKVSLK